MSINSLQGREITLLVGFGFLYNFVTKQYKICIIVITTSDHISTIII